MSIPNHIPTAKRSAVSQRWHAAKALKRMQRDPDFEAVRMRALYCVRACKMSIHGDQSLNLVGFGADDWFNASRFTRVPDPAGRKWPTSRTEGSP